MNETAHSRSPRAAGTVPKILSSSATQTSDGGGYWRTGVISGVANYALATCQTVGAAALRRPFIDIFRTLTAHYIAVSKASGCGVSRDGVRRGRRQRRLTGSYTSAGPGVNNSDPGNVLWVRLVPILVLPPHHTHRTLSDDQNQTRSSKNFPAYEKETDPFGGSYQRNAAQTDIGQANGA